LDALTPGQRGLARGAVHELLSAPGVGSPLLMAALLARAATSASAAAIVWCDLGERVYPPALARMGIDLGRLFFLRTKDEAEQCWAMSECLRCKGVGAVVARVGRMTRVQARRLQLAAEQSGAVGILLRPGGEMSRCYAAATRWLVRCMPGERTIQRWAVELVHGHGGRLGQRVFLERYRDATTATNSVCAVAELGDRSAAAQTARRRRA
jgi:protein ImuA